MIATCQCIAERYHNTREIRPLGDVFLFPKASGRARELATQVARTGANLLILNGLFLPATMWGLRQNITSKSLNYRDYQSRLFVIDRGESYGRSLSLKITGRKDSDHAARKPNAVFYSVSPPASAPSGTSPTMGYRRPLASHATAGRKSYPARCARAARAALVRTSRTDLNRGRFLASRFRSWGAVANRPASPHPYLYRRLQP